MDQVQKKQQVDNVICKSIMDLYIVLGETKGIGGMENDFINLFQKLLNINKKLCNKTDDTSVIESVEYYHNAINYYEDEDEDDEKEEIYCVDQQWEQEQN